MKDSYLSESDVQDIINAVGYECKNPRGLREALESVFFDPSHWKVRYPTKAASLKKNLGEKKDFDDFFDKIDEAILLTLTSLKVLNEDLTKEYGFLTQSDLDKAFLVIASMGKLYEQKAQTYLQANLEQRKQIEEGFNHTRHPLNILIGSLLPRIYEAYFSRDWGMSRPSSGEGEAGGPSIRFTQEILKKMGIRKSAEAIYKINQRAKEYLADN